MQVMLSLLSTSLSSQRWLSKSMGKYSLFFVNGHSGSGQLLSLIRYAYSCALLRFELNSNRNSTNIEAQKEAELRRQLLADYLLVIVRKIDTRDESLDLTWINNTVVSIVAKVAYSE